MNEATTLRKIISELENNYNLTLKNIFTELNKTNNEQITKRISQFMREHCYYAYIFPVDPSEPVIAVRVLEGDNDY